MEKNFDLAAEIAAVVETGVDQSVAKSGGGGEYTPPAKGMARARLIGYYELGIQEVDELNDQGQKIGLKDENQVELVFELSGPNHPPKVLDDGTVIPLRISTKGIKLSTHKKAGFFQIFSAMNYEGNAKHMVQLLGKPFLVTVYHKTGANGRVYAQLKGSDKTEPKGKGFDIRGPKVQDPETGADKILDVAPAISPLSLYLFDTQNRAMWDALFIAGEYPEFKDEKTGDVIRKARSKNVLQERIKNAKNFKTSIIGQAIAAGATRDLDIPDADRPKVQDVPPVSDDEQLDDIPF